MKIILLQKLSCKRCGHQWIPRQPEIRICPKCKTSWFDVSKKVKRKPLARKKELEE